MIGDLPGLAALVGSIAALFGAGAFWLRSRAKINEIREERLASNEEASEEARQRAEADTRLDRDRWRARAEQSEEHARSLARENVDLREQRALGEGHTPPPRRLKP